MWAIDLIKINVCSIYDTLYNKPSSINILILHFFFFLPMNIINDLFIYS